MKKFRNLTALTLALTAAAALTACGGSTPTESSTPAESTAPAESGEKVTVYLDAAASMRGAFEELIPQYTADHPNVDIVLNTGSSGTLLSQIEESAAVDHDIFFSAGKKQVKTLDETDGLVVDGSAVDLLSNALCLVKGKGTETEVSGWDTLNQAKNMALCDGTVPVGKYTREALVTLGVLEGRDDNSSYTSQEITEALGGVEINECADVTTAAQAVAEQSNEVGTIYYTDYYAYQDQLDIIAKDDGTLTGSITYPVCLVSNPEADEAEQNAAREFYEYLQTEDALTVFEDYCFIVNR